MGVLEWQKEGALSLFAWEADGGIQRGLIHHRLSSGIFHPQFWDKGRLSLPAETLYGW